MRKLLCALFFLFSAKAWAGEIVLKNGDRLTGRIIRMDRSSLDFQTELFGKVSVPWNAVAKMESDTLVYVSVGERDVVAGPVSMQDGRIEVKTEENKVANFPKDLVRSMRSEEEQRNLSSQTAAPETQRKQNLWGGSIDAAISATRGNANTMTLNFGIRTARISSGNKLSLYLTSVFSNNSNDRRAAAIADTMRGGSRYEVNLGPRFFGFGFTDIEHDQFQGLTSRFVGGGGLGLYVFKNTRNVLQVFSGGSANREEFQDRSKRRSREFVAGYDFAHQLTSATSLTESLIAYPNLSSRGEYRVTFDSSLVTRLNSWLAWQVTASNRYASNPAVDRKNNDLLLTTGIRFVHRGETLQNVEARPQLRRK